MVSHVAQGSVHGAQTLLMPMNPGKQIFIHEVPAKNIPLTHEIQAASDVHIKHGVLHPAQTLVVALA